MGKRKGSQFWQSAWMNDMAFRTYRLWILTLAVNRYKWINLPTTCDARWLEQTLALEGIATISTPKGGSLWTSTQAVADGSPNIYGTPRRWRSFGVDGFGYDVDPSNGVLIYATQLRTPFPVGAIDMYARRLADLDRAADINIQHQKRPWLITAPQEKVQDLVNVYKQAAGGEPAILGLKGLTSEIDVQAFGTPVPLILTDLSEERRRIWNEIYTMLGVQNITWKAERQIEDEVKTEKEPSDLMALDGLQSRRETGVYPLRERFGADFSEVDVVWNSDNISRIFQARALYETRLMEGDDHDV